MKKILLTAALAVSISSFAVADGEQSVLQGKQRMDALADLFKKNGVNTFDMLNGVGAGGSGSDASSKGKSTYTADLAVIQSSDARASLSCVKDGRWAVKQIRPLDVNKSALDDAIFVKAVEELRKNPNGNGEVSFDIVVGEGATKETRKVLAYSSKRLLGQKNDTGSKFVCWTSSH